MKGIIETPMYITKLFPKKLSNKKTKTSQKHAYKTPADMVNKK